MVVATGVKGNFLTTAVIVLIANNVEQAVSDSYRVMSDKKTFGSTLAFTAEIVAANTISNYLMYKNIKYSDLENAHTKISLFKGGALFMTGLHIVPIITNYTTNFIGKAFDINETFEEFVNQGKLKAVTMLAGSATIAGAATQLFSSLVGIENKAVKVYSTISLVLPVFIALANNDSKITIDNIKCTILGMVSSDHEC